LVGSIPVVGEVRWRPGLLYDNTGPRLRCTLCPYRCFLDDGQVGVCQVRRGAGAVVETATFATTVVHVDAVERKPFYHYRPGRSAVTLAAPGCTFRCDYCVNFRISQYGRSTDAGWSARPVDPAAIVAAAEARSACVALSYSEPSLAIELTLALAEQGRARGVEVVWKSNGFLTPEAVDLAAPALAAVNIDVKGVDDVRHRRLTGAPAAPVIETLRRFKERGVWVEVATPLIPGVSADPEDLTAIAELLVDVDPAIPWHLLRFTPAYRMSDHAPTAPDELDRARRIGLAAGLRHVYVERALGPAGRTTWCPGCGAAVVERDVWAVAANRIRGSACPDCGTRLEGRW
jgi:pyruvate formate lyase activating enzyme